MIRTPWLVPMVLAALGCGGSALPPPTIVSVSPSQRAASASGPVTVILDAVLPTAADYGKNSATVDDGMTLRIGNQAFGPARWTDGGVVTDFLPSVLLPARYDVTLLLGDSRTATASEAFVVTQGVWPSSYAIDPIPTETSGVPFGVTLRALGAVDGGFDGTVFLSEQGGATVTPPISGPFQNGLRVESITVTGAGVRRLIVTDLANHTVTSNPFTVLP